MKATLTAAVLAAACLLTACGGGGTDANGNLDDEAELAACPPPAPAVPGMSTVPTKPCRASAT